jgi:hypothetical protein
MVGRRGYLGSVPILSYERMSGYGMKHHRLQSTEEWKLPNWEVWCVACIGVLLLESREMCLCGVVHYRSCIERGQA